MKKKTPVTVLAVIICILCIARLWFSHKGQSRKMSYIWTIQKNNQKILINSFSGSWNSTWDYMLSHSLSFLDRQKETLSINIIQSQTGWEDLFSIKDYLVIQSTGNHWLHIFANELLQKQISKFQNLSDKGLDYNITYQQWILSDNIYITGTYTNQFKENNIFEIKVQSYCGVSQYLKTKYSCDIDWNIIFSLPINTKTTQRTIDWKLIQQFK